MMFCLQCMQALALSPSLPAPTPPCSDPPRPPSLLPPSAVEMDRTKSFLVKTGVGSEVHHKEQYIPQAQLEGETVYCIEEDTAWDRFGPACNRKQCSVAAAAEGVCDGC